MSIFFQLILEFGSVIWKPQNNVNIEILEGFEKKVSETFRYQVLPQTGTKNSPLKSLTTLSTITTS